MPSTALQKCQRWSAILNGRGRNRSPPTYLLRTISSSLIPPFLAMIKSCWLNESWGLWDANERTLKRVWRKFAKTELWEMEDLFSSATILAFRGTIRWRSRWEAVSRCRSTVRSKFWRLSHDDMQQQVHQPLTLSNILFSWLIFCDRPWHLLVLVRGILKIRAIGVEVIKEFLYVIRVNVTRLTRAKRGLQFKMKTTNGWYYMMIS